MRWARTSASSAGTWLGPAAAVLLLALVDLDPQRASVTAMAAIAAWMAVWWMTEAVPLAITALLRSGRTPNDPAVAKGLKYLSDRVRVNGAICGA
ncbi:hypothetical protein KKG45_14245, partial [bacterium]|nr:hypothetical protein [bacterium]